MKKSTIFLLILAFGYCSNLMSQKILKSPILFENPINYSEDSKMYFQVNHVNKKTKRNLWMVFGDRTIDTYTSADENRVKTEKKFKFKDYAYVTEEKGEWIYLMNGRIDRRKGKFKEGAEHIGWVRKDNVLVWSNSLKDENSGIHQKAFILNKAADIKNIVKSKNRKSAYIYNGPNSSESIERKSIYSFYFILKREKNRFLLAKEYRLTSSGAKTDLVGWIDAQKVSIWNTRISLEPNFEPQAYEERKTDQSKRVLGFDSPIRADAYSKSGIIDEPFWDNDPIKINQNLLSKSNPRRHKGPQIRFPMLDKTSSYYSSGSINSLPTNSTVEGLDIKLEGDIGEVSEANMKELVVETSSKRKNLNVFFLVEATSSLREQKEVILESIEDIEFELPEYVNIKYGGALYRDTELASIGKDFELFAVDKNKNNFKSFVSSSNFEDYGEFDDYSNLYYAMKQSLIKGDFSKNATNVMIVIGNNSDFKIDAARKTAAKIGAEKKYIIKSSEISNKLSEYEVNTIFIQPNRVESKSSINFSKKARGIIISGANKLFLNYKDITKEYPGLKLKSPSITDDESDQVLTLEDGVNISQVYRPTLNNNLSSSEIKEFITSRVHDIMKLYDKRYHDISMVVNEGEAVDFNISSGYWDPGFANILMSKLKSYNDDKTASDDLKKIINEKFKLYHEVYLPIKLKDAKYPLFSYVLFMPESDLRDYVFMLKDLKLAIDGSPDQLRENLFLVFESMLQKFAGGKVSRRTVEKTSIDELRGLIQGITKEGYFIGEQLSYTIGDIRNRKRMSDEQLDEECRRIIDKYKLLNKIYHQGADYEFAYTSNESTYFWIPTDFLF